MYTFDDWLNDRIIPEFWEEENKLHSLYYILSSDKLSRDEWIKIQEKQLETWNNALDINLRVYQKYINDHLMMFQFDPTSNSDEFIEIEKDLLMEEINKDRRAYQDTLKPYKLEINNITGSDYSNVRLNMAKGVPVPIKLNIPEPDLLNFEKHLLRKKVDYLNGLKLTDDKAQNGPVFIEIDSVLEILNRFFNSEDQIKLKEILTNGSNVQKKLIFLNGGNRLADLFKQLIDADYITGCNKKGLEEWIQKNFKYQYRGKIKEFSSKYLNDIVSTTKDKCQKPIINIIKDKSQGKYRITRA